MNTLITLGQIAIVAQSFTQVAITETQTNDVFSKPVETSNFKSHYESSEKGMAEFLKDLGVAYNVKIPYDEITQTLKEDPKLFNQIISDVNVKLSRRGFWSFFSGIAKTIGGAIGTAVTLGQVDATKDLTVDGANQVKENAGSTVDALGNTLGLVTDIIGAAKGDGEAGAGVPGHIMGIIDNA